jgi:hypothetical protein
MEIKLPERRGHHQDLPMTTTITCLPLDRIANCASIQQQPRRSDRPSPPRP